MVKLIYTRLVDELHNRQVRLHYAVHISGHGWRKIMRPQKQFTYVIDRIPQPQPIFRLIQEVSGMSNEQIYGDYNMSAGFALFADQYYVPIILNTAKALGFTALDAGVVEPGPKKVVIKPVGVEYQGEALQVR